MKRAQQVTKSGNLKSGARIQVITAPIHLETLVPKIILPQYHPPQTPPTPISILLWRNTEIADQHRFQPFLLPTMNFVSFSVHEKFEFCTIVFFHRKRERKFACSCRSSELEKKRSDSRNLSPRMLSVISAHSGLYLAILW